LKTAEKVLKQIEERAETEGWPIIGPSRGALLDSVVKKYKPKLAVEIGTLVGYSAIRMARLLPKGGRIVCVEINGRMAEVARSNIASAGFSEVVEVKVGDAKEIIPKLAGPFDLAFLDAAKEEYLTYLKLLEKNLRKGSVIVADNVKSHAEGMKDYLDYVRGSEKYSSSYREGKSAFFPEGDAVEVTVKIR
jgi:predicted O-methyltransferase YrrM